MFCSYKNYHALDPPHPHIKNTCHVVTIFINFIQPTYGFQMIFHQSVKNHAMFNSNLSVAIG